jgi:hypothetical protein
MIFNPYSDSRFLGFVSLVAPYATNVHFPSSLLLKKFFSGDQGFHALTGRYIIIEGTGNGFLGKITEIALPEKERLQFTETRYEKEEFHPVGKVEIMLCFNSYELKANKGLEQLPPVGAKVFLCSDEFLGALLTDFGKGEDGDRLIPLASLPGESSYQINVSGQALFGRHCAIVGTTGGGKSWTIAKLIEEVCNLGGKAIVIDPTGEYETLSSSQVWYRKFSGGSDRGTFLNYKNLRETDLYALFRPSQQSQLPKLQEAMKSLRLIQHLDKKTLTPGDSEESFIKNYVKKNDEHGYSWLKKGAEADALKFMAACKNNPEVYSPLCCFNINALASQILKECVTAFGADDMPARNNCQSLISRILLTTNDKSFEQVFDFKGTQNGLGSQDFSLLFTDFMSSNANVLILSVAEVSTDNKLREILINALGRFLLEKALNREFKSNKKSLILFLDEAHLFLNKKIKDEYSIEVDLNAFDRIAKECRKFGLFLVLSTQMPRDIPRGVLSQMGCFIVHRLINQFDREAIEYACSEASKSALSFLPILSSGEAMLTGVDFPMPMILKINRPLVPPDSGTPMVF